MYPRKISRMKPTYGNDNQLHCSIAAIGKPISARRITFRNSSKFDVSEIDSYWFPSLAATYWNVVNGIDLAII